MSSAQVGAVLRHLRKLAASPEDHELPDGQLLERFALHRDESALAALLDRHGPMVLGVCRNVLHDLHDAEDAFQACFLLLAQKAGSIHRREAVSGWLYRVAYHLAVRAKASASRRKVLERRAAPMPPADPVLDMSLREVRAVLLEELEGLPEQYRAALVLCGLEEKSLGEAARLLGWTRGAVKGRLQRGRELLRGRLRRRGLELPAALAATALALRSASARVPAALADSTLRVAVKAAGGGALAGVVSAEVAALVGGASKAMMLGKLKVLTALLLLVGLAAAGLGTITLRAPAAGRAGPERKEAAPAGKDAGDTLTVRGRVIGPDGKGVAGAKLYLHDRDPGDKGPAVRATSGADGRFKFTLARSERGKKTPGGPAGQVVAVARGYGCDWASVGEAEAGRELTLRLVKDVPIQGRVRNQEGKPVAGAKVRVMAVAAYPGEDLTKMLEEFRRVGWPTSLGVKKRWEGPLPGQPRVVRVGADGRFRLAGFGRERVVRLLVEGPGIEYAPIEVMTRAGEGVSGSKPPEGYRGSRLYPATFEYLPAPSRPIRGVVRDKATGKPVAGVTFWSYVTTHRPVADSKGRYEMLGLPKAPTYMLYLVPPDGRHFAIRVRVRDKLGLGPLRADVDLPSGISVRGRVLDKVSGKPVAGVRVSYFVLFPNPKVGKLDQYHEYEGLSSATTGPDGSYAVTVLPGPGVLAAAAQPASAYRPALVTVKEQLDFIKARPDTFVSQDSLVVHGTGGVADARNMFISQLRYNALVLINPGEKDKGLVRDLVLLPALARKGTVVGPDGKLLAGVLAVGLESEPGQPGWSKTLNSASFTVRGLHPGRTRQLFFYHKGKDLGAYLELRGDRSEALKVRLRPCGSVADRLVDKAGKPVGGAVIYICRQGYGVFFPGTLQARTDQQGRFRAEGLVPGQKYTMTRHTTNIVDSLPRDLNVEPGKKKDLGDLAVAPMLRD